MQVRGGASSSPLTVVLEDCSFEVTDIVAGIALILALYWVHDISCCPKASWSLAVIGNFIGLTYKTKSFLVLDLISKLEDWDLKWVYFFTCTLKSVFLTSTVLLFSLDLVWGPVWAPSEKAQATPFVLWAHAEFSSDIRIRALRSVVAVNKKCPYSREINTLLKGFNVLEALCLPFYRVQAHYMKGKR